MQTVQENSLVQIVEQSGLEKTKGQILLEKFSVYFDSAAQVEAKLNLLGEEDFVEAGKIRKELKASRVEAEKIRKELKESSLREGQTIDAIGRIIKNLIEPLEEKAEKIEKAKEIKAAKEKEAKKIERLNMLSQFNVASDANIIADMSDEMFSSYLAGVEKDYLAAKEAERLAEIERMEKERKMEEEREAQRLENIRLKAEAEAREKEIAAEREKAEKERLEIEAKLKAEAEAREKLEREAREKEEAEKRAAIEAKEKAEKEKAEKEEADRLAMLAPRKEKITAWVDNLIIGSPVGMEEDKAVIEINEKFEAFKNWAKERVKNIK